MAGSSDIHLYTSFSPNGRKVSVLLEELGLPYQVTEFHLPNNTQKEEWFLKINPNGRIPALTDTFTDGNPIHLFESGSILQYIVDRYDTENKVSYPRGSKEYYEVNNWLFWQVGGLGPMQGQANHFLRYTPEKIPYGINRYQNETRRLYRILDKQLSKSKSGFVVGDRLSLADIACIGWVSFYDWGGIDIEEFPNVKAWLQMMTERPAVSKGLNVPESKIGPEPPTPEFMEMIYRISRNWIQESMAEEAKK